MTPERWQEVKKVLATALERAPGERNAYLDQACTEPDLRREVESLIAAHEQSQSSFLAQPAIQAKELAIGSRLGPYEILSRIGAGGMGEVYKARDTRLDRTVAVKILSDRLADRSELRERFEREGRTIASLNHPHICTLYDIGRQDGVDYLVMEYVSGKSLSKLIKPRGLPFAEALHYAQQIASALAAAHAAGIVHRDIKPANVIVTPEGQVKILDFGLAKLEERRVETQIQPRTMEPTLTVAGVVMGTAGYMSPEQARAEEVDARTDLFSFGVVLYEMATGRRAFSKAFDWATPATQGLPPELQRIVLKLLEVDRELRYQTAADVAADIKRLQRAAEGGNTPRRRWIAAAAGLATLAIAAAAVVSLRPGHPLGRVQWVQLTNFPDSVSQPTLSRDGRMLAFIRGPETFIGPGQIYIKLLPNGEPVQLTRDNLTKMSPMFSPDGSRIAYSVNQALKWDTWVVPLLNGQARRWLENASGLAWLDNHRLLFSEVKKDIHMGIVMTEDTRAGERDVYLPAGERGMAHRSYPSPDGKSALVVEMDRGDWLPCRLVPINGGSAGRPVGPQGAGCTFAAWSPDGRWMYFSSGAGGVFHTWRQRSSDDRPEQITSGLTQEEGIAVAPDGRSLISSVALTQSVVLVHDASGERQVSLEGYSYDPKFTPDGKRLCYRILKGPAPTYNASGELHVVELDTGDNEPLLPGLAVSGEVGLAYNISPDGRQVVAAAPDDEGKPRLWLAALDRQSPPRQIPNVEGDMPLFGKGDEIFFRAIEGASAFAYRVREDGTGLQKVSKQTIAGNAGISQDGQWVVAKVPGEEGSTIAAFPVSGGSLIRIISARATSQQHLTWSPDGKLMFISAPIGYFSSNITGRTYVVPLPPGRMLPQIPAGGFQSEAEIAKLPGARVIDGYDVAPGPTPGVYAFSRGTVQRNLYRIPIP
jgi:Tol biopolymer transport system component/tRNA A-37 threonylcarbamoyl transferase component Bud32